MENTHSALPFFLSSLRDSFHLNIALKIKEIIQLNETPMNNSSHKPFFL